MGTPFQGLPHPSTDVGLDWLKARFGPYSVENPPPYPMEVSVRGGDYHAVAFILAMRQRSKMATASNSTSTPPFTAYSPQPHRNTRSSPSPSPSPSSTFLSPGAHSLAARSLSLHSSTIPASTLARSDNPTPTIATQNSETTEPENNEHPFSVMAREATRIYRSEMAESNPLSGSAEAALYARPGQLKRDKPLGQGQTYLHLACQYVMADDPSVLWNMIDILLHEGYHPMAHKTDGATPLHVLVQEQPEALESIKLLVQHGADVNYATEKGLSVLHTLAHSYKPGCLEAMKLLVSLGADIKAISVHGWSVMHTFARYNSDPYDCIKYLIERGLSVHTRTDEQCTVLHALARCFFKNEYSRASKDMFKTLKLVVEHGVDVNAKTVKKWTALHYTAKDNPEPVDALAYLLEKGADVNVIGADGWSVLHCLVRYNKKPLEGIKLLVKAGVDVNVLKAQHATALHSLAKHCQDPYESYESIRVLLNAGVDVNKQGKKDWTTLHFLVYSNKKPMAALRLLLEAGATVHDKTADGWSPTHLLANSNVDPLEALKILVEFGADVNAVGKNGWSVLHSVARCTPKPLESIRFLLQCGADPKVVTQDGWSILHFLANYCKDPLESMRLLIEAGANVNAKTKSDWTSLHLIARANPQPYELFKLLLSYGADATAIGHKEWTVLHSLVRYHAEPYECVELLLQAGADFSKRTGSDWTCMDLLTRYCPNPVPSMKLLLSRGAVLTGQSIFHIAEHNRDPVEALNLILQHKPSGISDQESKGYSAMHVVIIFQVNPIPALEVLLKHGADINAKGHVGQGHVGRSPLHEAIARVPGGGQSHINLAAAGGPGRPGVQGGQGGQGELGGLGGPDQTGGPNMLSDPQEEPDELLDWLLAHGADPYQTFDDGGPMNALLLAARLGKEDHLRVLWDWIGDELTMKEIEMARSEAQGRKVREFLRKQIQRRREMNCLEPSRALKRRTKKKVAPISSSTSSSSPSSPTTAAAMAAIAGVGVGAEAGTGTGSTLQHLTYVNGDFVGGDEFEEEEDEEEVDYDELVIIGHGENDTLDEEAARLRSQYEEMAQHTITETRSSLCWRVAREQFLINVR